MDAEEKKLHVKLAYGYYQDKEYKKALQLYKRLHEADGEDVNVLSMIGDTYFKGKNAPKALDAYTECITLYEKKGQYPKCIKLIKKIRKTFSEDQRVTNKLTAIMRIMIRDAEKKVLNHDYDNAREIYDSLAEFNNEENPINIKLKELNDEESKYKDREMKLKKDREVEKPNEQNELIGKFEKMAENYINNGDYDGAVETYITALKLAPNNKELRKKLHRVYAMVANENSGDQVWNKIDGRSLNKLEEAKQAAIEERQQKIMAEEESRARLLLEQEAKIQREYEEKEMEIIQAAAGELKHKLALAQKKEKLKKEEIQRIMKEQEAKKRELLEKIKSEAVAKFKAQKEAIKGPELKSEVLPISPPPVETKPEKQEIELPPPPVEAKPEKQEIELPPPPESNDDGYTDEGIELPSSGSTKTGKKSLLDALQGAYETPALDQAAVNAAKEMGKNKETTVATGSGSKIDDIINGDNSDKKDDTVVTEDTIDSLVTTAFIYINQNLLKEALHIYNKIVEVFPDNLEAKQILKQVSRQQDSTQ